jgi:hypothetical protein
MVLPFQKVVQQARAGWVGLGRSVVSVEQEPPTSAQLGKENPNPSRKLCVCVHLRQKD